LKKNDNKIDNNGVYSEHSCIPAIGNDFKEYIMQNNMPEKIRVLKSGLDDLSIRHIDFAIDAIANFPTAPKSLFFSNKPMKHYYPDWIKAEADLADLENSKLRDQGFWGGYETLYYAHGLTLVPTKVLDYVSGKIFMDLGAWDGDSAMSLSRFRPSKILSFDISLKNADKQKIKTKEIKVPHEIFINALSDKKGVMQFQDEGTWSDTLHGANGGCDTVELDTMDNFMRGAGEHEVVGLIKADIEGDEMNMLHGAVETIRRDRPIISVSIYHDPISFFEIKPFIESLRLNYKFIIRVLGFYDNGPINETTLIAYPAEIGSVKVTGTEFI
jgi:FkbM family methyltransferase